MTNDKKFDFKCLYKKYSLIATIFIFIVSLSFVYTLFDTPLDTLSNNFSITINSISIVLIIPLIAKSIYCSIKSKCSCCIGKTVLYTYLLIVYICWIVYDKQSANGHHSNIDSETLFAFSYLTLTITTSLLIGKIVSIVKCLKTTSTTTNN